MGGSSSQSTSSGLTKWSKGIYNDLSGQVRSLNGQAYTPYTGQLTAGLDPLQMQAGHMAQANVGAGQGLLGQAAQGASAAQGYTPQQVNAQSLGGTDLSQYLNPYMDSVAGGVLGQLNRGREMAINGQAGDFTRAGAFGGSRHGVADAETNRAFADTAANTLNNIYSQGFGNAQQAAQFDIGNNLNAQGMNQQAGLSGAGLNLNASGLLGDLAGQQQQMGQSDASFLNQFGQQAQQNAQQGLGANYSEFLRGQGANQQQISNLLSLLHGTPMLTNSTTSQSSSPGLGQIIGTGLQAAALFSDARLKKDVEPAGTDAKGRRWYDFRYLWERDDAPKTRGVMAQELLGTPDAGAVCTHPAGFLMVNYGAL
jgi:hypothetical protein